MGSTVQERGARTGARTASAPRLQHSAPGLQKARQGTAADGAPAAGAIMFSSSRKRRAGNLPAETIDKLEAYLDQHYAYRADVKYRSFCGKIKALFDRADAEAREREQSKEKLLDENYVYGSDPYVHALENFIQRERENIKNSFYNHLLKKIQEKNLDQVEVYKQARIDRKLFSKIRCIPDYIPAKKTVLSLAISMHLSIDETVELLKYCGFSLSETILFDVIISFYISNKHYDIDDINNALFEYTKSTL